MRTVAAVLALASSTLAYQVTSPNGNTAWHNQGSNELVWNRVSTDPLNFTVVLDNQSISGWTPQVLAALVDGNLGKVNLNPPNPGWTVGEKFRVNLVQDEDHVTTLYAQSPEFDIKEGSSSSTASGTKSATATSKSGSTSTGSSTSSSDSSTSSDTQNVPPSGAALANSVNMGAVAIFGALVYVLA